jgi:transaldolase
MKFFADTAEIADIKELAATGLLDGVTTNPSLIMKSGRDFIEVTKEICGLSTVRSLPKWSRSTMKA